MEKKITNSSQIDRIKYFPSNNTLEVEFKKGKVYHYKNVPQTFYEDFKNAPSAGQYFNDNIKGKYEFSKIM